MESTHQIVQPPPAPSPVAVVPNAQGEAATVTNPGFAVVTLEGATPADVSGNAAHNLALQAAGAAIGAGSIRSTSGAYPVDAHGRPIDSAKSGANPFGLPAGSRFRQDFEVAGGWKGPVV